jgi:hypothetical protein
MRIAESSESQEIATDRKEIAAPTTRRFRHNRCNNSTNAAPSSSQPLPNHSNIASNRFDGGFVNKYATSSVKCKTFISRLQSNKKPRSPFLHNSALGLISGTKWHAVAILSAAHPVKACNIGQSDHSKSSDRSGPSGNEK